MKNLIKQLLRENLKNNNIVRLYHRIGNKKNIYGPDFITRISFWSINRDNQYPPATPPNSLSVNSYVNQDQWGFTNIFQAFNA